MGVTCFLAAILSGWCTWTYVATAMAVRTESDGSLVFWYLPFLFAGILLALLSIGAALLWIRLGRAAA